MKPFTLVSPLTLEKELSNIFGEDIKCSGPGEVIRCGAPGEVKEEDQAY